MQGPANAGVTALIAQDPGAVWNGQEVASSCAPTCAPISPRIVPIAVFDVDEFQWRREEGDWSPCPAGGKCVRVVNILGFFVDGIDKGNVTGHLVTVPGEFIAGAPSVGGGAAFLMNIRLVR
jgi:hypothetical protein